MGLAERGDTLRHYAAMSISSARISIGVVRIGPLDPERDGINCLNGTKGSDHVGEKLLVCDCMGT